MNSSSLKHAMLMCVAAGAVVFSANSFACGPQSGGAACGADAAADRGTAAAANRGPAADAEAAERLRLRDVE